MKKMFKIQYGIFACILLLMGACKKETPDVPKDDDRDVRILKVQYLGYDNLVLTDPIPPMYLKECTYHYDTDGRLTRIENDGVRRATVEYSHEQIKATNHAEQNQVFTSYWNNSVISFQGKRIDNIVATTRHLSIEPHDFTTWDRIDISRTSAGKLKSVMPEVSPDDLPILTSSTYSGLATEILSYNSNGMPDKLEAPLFYWADTNYYTADFAFQYNAAEDVPMKLKRLVNEELLFSNLYGITTTLDFFLIDSTRNFSQFGEGNWLLSFGLSQYYILEEKSTHLVSKRTTNYYKGGIKENGDPDGTKEFLKTTVKDFPYKHDVKAKTLEIAGVKIWYEFVE